MVPQHPEARFQPPALRQNAYAGLSKNLGGFGAAGKVSTACLTPERIRPGPRAEPARRDGGLCGAGIVAGGGGVGATADSRGYHAPLPSSRPHLAVSSRRPRRWPARARGRGPPPVLPLESFVAQRGARGRAGLVGEGAVGQVVVVAPPHRPSPAAPPPLPRVALRARPARAPRRSPPTLPGSARYSPGHPTPGRAPRLPRSSARLRPRRRAPAPIARGCSAIVMAVRSPTRCASANDSVRRVVARSGSPCRRAIVPSCAQAIAVISRSPGLAQRPAVPSEIGSPPPSDRPCAVPPARPRSGRRQCAPSSRTCSARRAAWRQ